MQGGVEVLEVGAGVCRGVGGKWRREEEVLEVGAGGCRGVGGRCRREEEVLEVGARGRKRCWR